MADERTISSTSISEMKGMKSVILLSDEPPDVEAGCLPLFNSAMW
jgi:hypothetical protein